MDALATLTSEHTVNVLEAQAIIWRASKNLEIPADVLTALRVQALDQVRQAMECLRATMTSESAFDAALAGVLTQVKEEGPLP